MPERQSSTGEETARPATDGGGGPEDRPSGSANGAPDGTTRNGNGNGAAPDTPAPVADQVAEQVAAEPGAGEPGGHSGADPIVSGVEAAPDASATALFGPPARPGGTEANASPTPRPAPQAPGAVAPGAQPGDARPAHPQPGAGPGGRPAGQDGASTPDRSTTDRSADPTAAGTPAAAAGSSGNAPTGAGPVGAGPAVPGHNAPGGGNSTGSAAEAPGRSPSSSQAPGSNAPGADAPAGARATVGGPSPVAPGSTGASSHTPGAAPSDTAQRATGTAGGERPGTGRAGGDQDGNPAGAGGPAGAQPGAGQFGSTRTQQPPTGRPSPGRSAEQAGRPGGSGADTRDATVRTPLPSASAAAATTASAATAVGAPAGGAEAPTRPTARPGTAQPAPGPRGDGATVAVAPSPTDAESTQVIPLSTTATPSASPVDPPTERLQVVPAARPPVPPQGGGTGSGERRRKPVLIGAAAVAALAALYVGDLLLTSGSVPRGTTVAGVDVGGLALVDAEQELRTAIEPRATQPVPVTAGTVTSEIDPVAAGLNVDWAGTLDQAGAQPLNPFTRIASFFSTSRTLGVVTTADDQALTTAVEQLGPVVDTEPVEGTVRFEGVTPVPVDPVPGQQLDPPAAVQAIKANWASGVPVALPLISLPALTTPEDVATAVEDVATPAVSGPVTVVGEQDTQGVLEPEVIAAALSFEPGEGGGLDPVLNPTVITDALDDQLAASEQEAKDAELDFSTTPPTVVPSQDGRGVDYEATLAELLPVLTGTGPREITAVYAAQPADLTTDELGGLGNAGQISTFTTRGFAQDSGLNIRRAAELVDGTVVGPGETFSLDAVTGPRTAANGYVEAGVIDNGRAGRGIAGGVSQVSTTTYNAAYFAGMTDIEHRPHSFYISRYPEGREATIVTGALDMRFRNDTPTAVLIRTAWTPSEVTVTFYGTQYYDVSSSTSERSNFTSPSTVNVPAGEQCNPSQGAQGFTVTDTRTLRNRQTGEVTSESQRTVYNPAPIVVCGG